MNRLFVPFSFSLLLGAPTLVACSGGVGDPAPEDTGAQDDAYAEILSDIDFGAQMTVIEPDGTVWSGAAGDATSADAMTNEHVLLVGSNTKMLTAAIVLQLVEEGALALDDTAATWVPQLRADISIRMLLRHTSGIGEYFEHEAMTADAGHGITQPWTPEALIGLGIEVRDDGPAQQARYANTNYVALGLVIEAITGQPFEEVLHERIFAPVGMTSGGLMMADDPYPPNIAFGDGGALGVVTREHPSVGWAAGSAYMTSADLARFISAVARGELYGSALLAEQLDRVDWTENDSPGVDGWFGLGIMMFDVQGGRFDGHLGSVVGFSGVALVDESSGTTVVTLTNQDDMMTTAVLTFRAFGVDLGM